MLFGTSCILIYDDASTHPQQKGLQVWTNEDSLRSYDYSPFSLLGSLKAIARDSSWELHGTVVQILMLTGLLTQASPCAKLHKNQPSVSEWNASNKQDHLCAGLNENNIRGHRLRNLQAEKIHAREITLNCTEQWRESALEATRSLGKHCVKDTLETYLHECSAQSLRKAACTGIPPLHVLKCFHYEPGCDTWFF